ncbi:MAG: FAD-dependent monooxygenase [Candidatus Binatus sp.]|uniref:FAD-dependent monooxygenase n=1 Tax=Candidatus Binatus sp. TaxID=2811406 RepID=UPI0027286676|nr:FAD-dependent monooxygenase [Candidatus Binatus sp.]MDO8433009.1 FAD-dependent monooxygenase [Candidatus Binatus sp.]
MNRKYDIPVLIVGAGPVGLMLACELVRHGVECRIIDKAGAASDKSKALGIHARTLEIFDNIAIADEMIAAGHKGHGISAYSGGKRIAHVSLDQIPSRYQFVLMLPQNETERMLAKHLASLGVQVERSVELSGFTQDGDGVIATLKAADGREEKCHSAWLAGCDGAHSTVRHTLGLEFEGEQYEESFWLADVLLDFREADDELYAYAGNEEMAVLFPMGHQRWRIVGTRGPAEGDAAPTLPEVQTMLDKLIGGGVRAHDPFWLAHFSISRRRVKQYNVGRAFLCGDAAHIHSPAGGQGMNTGLQDAHNLAWKLALVANGDAKPELLASYQAERHPVAAEVLRETDMMTRVITLRSPIAKKVRDRLAPIFSALEVVQDRASRALSETAVNYRRSPIVSEHRSGLVESIQRAGASGVGAWYDFAHGPAPGDRAPDVEYAMIDSGEVRRLNEVMRGPNFNLLLFSGIEDDRDLSDLFAIADSVKGRFGTHVSAHLIDASDAPQSHPHVTLIRDLSHLIHRAYGAGSRCIYLIRPDGYVGFRAQPPDQASLLANLGNILK